MDNNICNVCKKETKNLSFEPTRKQLLFGGFHMRKEWRCPKCEAKIEKEVSQTIKRLK